MWDDIVKVGGIGSHTSGPKAILESVARSARYLTSADWAWVGLSSDRARPFDFWIASGGTDEKLDEVAPRPVGLLGAVLRDARSLRLDARRRSLAMRGFPLLSADMGAFLGVPILRRDQAVGAVYLVRRPGSEPFSVENQRMIELLVAHASVAIENERLYRSALEAVRERELITAMVSHDLKNPLAYVLLVSDFIMRSSAMKNAPEVYKHLDGIRRASSRMARLVDDLVDATRIEQGRLVIAKASASARELLDELAEAFGAVASNDGITLEVQPPVEGLVLQCDRDRLLQVLSNLLSNAIKFTPRGGRVTVRIERHRFEHQFTVEDNGVGIAAADLPHVFDRYWQAKDAHQSGSGLGLSIAKGIVEAHGGRIWAESNNRTGSAFSFTVPL
jgi:signal transduction histidine kinase